MLMIRLQRVGKKNQAMFRLVLTDKQNGPKSGRFTELLGSYNPHTNHVQFNAERITHWISMGAQPSDTVHNLLIREDIIKGKKRNVLPKKTPIVKEASEEEKTESAPETPATEEAPAEKAADTEASPAETNKPAEAPTETPTTEEKKEEAAKEETPENK